MWNTLTGKFSAVIRSARRPGRNERGQGILEYLLVVAVVVTIFLVLAKPYMTKMGTKFQTLFKQGVFASDSSGNAFYYYPMN